MQARKTLQLPKPKDLKQNTLEATQEFFDKVIKELDKQWRLIWQDSHTIQIDSDVFLYWGGKDTDGSWRFGRVGDTLVLQFRSSGTWADIAMRYLNTGHTEIIDGAELRFRDTGESHYVGFKAPALTANQIWTLPDADGIDGDHIETDGNGILSWVTCEDHAELYVNSNVTLTINTASQFYPGLNLATGSVVGMTVNQGEAGAITSIADAGGGDIEVTANNTMAVGDPVSLNDGTGYDGLYMVNAATATTFDVTAAFVATGTGLFIKGDNIIAAKTGCYHFDAMFSGVPATGAPVFEFAVAVNATLSDKGRPQRKFSNAVDVGNSGGSQLLSLSVGDRVTFLARNLTGTQNLVITQANINLSKQ